MSLSKHILFHVNQIIQTFFYKHNYHLWFPGLLLLLNLQLLPERHSVLDLGHVGEMCSIRYSQTSRQINQSINKSVHQTIRQKID